MTPEQEQFLIQSIQRHDEGLQSLQQVASETRQSLALTAQSHEAGLQSLRESNQELQRVVSETRFDIAHFAEWVEIATTAVQRLQTGEEQLNRILESQNRILDSLSAGYNHQQRVLDYLLRKEQERNDGSEPIKE